MMRVSLRKSDSTYNIIASEILFPYKQVEIENPDEINDGFSLYCSGVNMKYKNIKEGLAIDLT